VRVATLRKLHQNAQRLLQPDAERILSNIKIRPFLQLSYSKGAEAKNPITHSINESL
jgi:hypothetical protein